MLQHSLHELEPRPANSAPTQPKYRGCGCHVQEWCGRRELWRPDVDDKRNDCATVLGALVICHRRFLADDTWDKSRENVKKYFLEQGCQSSQPYHRSIQSLSHLIVGHMATTCCASLTQRQAFTSHGSETNVLRRRVGQHIGHGPLVTVNGRSTRSSRIALLGTFSMSIRRATAR